MGAGAAGQMECGEYSRQYTIWRENDSDRELEIYNLEKVMGSSNYILVPCNDDCQEGWIYTDKSHQLVDSNKG